MKKFLLFMILFALTTTLFAQTNSWTGAGANTNWNTVANWSLNAVPTATNDVIIPTGFTVNLNVGASIKSLTVNGNSIFEMNNNLAFTNSSTLAAGTTFNWNFGAMNGGALSSNGIMNMSTANDKYLQGATIINNAGTINFPSTCVFYFYNDAVINNLGTGTIDIKSAPIITYSGGGTRHINNMGLFKKSADNGDANIHVAMTNSGTISVSAGNLAMLTEAKSFNGGVYNVSSGSTLIWGALINVIGNLTGVLNGPINWTGTVSSASTSTFNFTGSAQVNWSTGYLLGDGILNNLSTIHLATGNDKYFQGNTILNNTGIIDFPDTCVLYFYNNATLNNLSNGIIDIKSAPQITYSGGGARHINNMGLFKKSADTGDANIHVAVTNSGTISVSAGNLAMLTEAKTFNGGVYNVSAGSTLAWGSVINVSGILTGALNGPINWTGTVSSASTTTFNFTGSAQVNWSTGYLLGDGVLNNTSTIHLATASDKYFQGTTVLNNTGLIDFPATCVMYFYNDATLNNQSTGIIDIKSAPQITYSGGGARHINNVGLIKKSADPGDANIHVAITNSGTISVLVGNIGLYTEAKTFNGGIYNVSSGSSMIWGVRIDVSGILTGLLNGAINWTGTVSSATTATFNFTGSTQVNWSTGYLLGNGVLNNTSNIHMTTANDKYFQGATILNNTGIIDFPTTCVMYFYNAATLNNLEGGIVDIKSAPIITYSGSGTYAINNDGMFKKSNDAGSSNIYVTTTNSGTIDASFGTLNFANGLNNTIDGIIMGTAIVKIPPAANFTNNGTFAPGGSPGTLSVGGDFKSSATSILDVELYGLAANTGYDVLSITGNAIFAGNVNVTLNFAPSLNAQFIVATTSGTISQCTLAPTTSAEFNGMTYTFSVLCQNNNQVVLKVTNIVLGLDDYQLSESSIQLYPNPVNNFVTLKNVKNLELDAAQMMDVTGKVIGSFDLKNMGVSKEISLENYASGIYFFKINGLNNSIIKRIVKQ